MSERIEICDGAEALDEDNGDVRDVARRRTLKAGKILYNAGSFTLDCTVRDVSETGAKLQFEKTAADAPDTFFLYVDLDGTRVECEVAWRRGRDLGVRFISPIEYIGEKRKQSVIQTGAQRPRGSLLRKPLR